jgi:hypothetical protein
VETFFSTETFHAIRVKSFREKNSFRDQAVRRGSQVGQKRQKGCSIAKTADSDVVNGSWGCECAGA